MKKIILIILFVVFSTVVYAQVPTMPKHKMVDSLKDIKADQKTFFETYQEEKKALDILYKEKLATIKGGHTDFKAVMEKDRIQKEYKEKKNELLQNYRENYNRLKQNGDVIRGRADLPEEYEEVNIIPVKVRTTQKNSC